jgi:hypothetical protein
MCQKDKMSINDKARMMPVIFLNPLFLQGLYLCVVLFDKIRRSDLKILQHRSLSLGGDECNTCAEREAFAAFCGFFCCRLFMVIPFSIKTV